MKSLVHTPLKNVLLATVLGAFPLAAAAHAETVVIAMTDDGFTAPDVTVDQNAIITFVNKDSIPRWPASNLHPTHELYPEFDPGRAIEPGDLWTFRPTRPGTWRYHDHLNPHRTGTITVTAEEGEETAAPAAGASPAPAAPARSPQPPLSPLSPWQNVWRAITSFFTRLLHLPARPAAPAADAARFTAMSEAEQYEHLATLARQYGARAAWQAVKDTYTDEAGTSLGGRAHDLAHYAGTLIFAEQSLAGLTECDATFAFGCYHGFTQAAFTDSLDPLDDIARACERLGPRTSGPWASCIHGIGHGVATFFNASDLPGALAACDALEHGPTFCHDGVFMEFSFSAPSSVYNADDPLAPCTALDPRYRPACGRNQPHVMERRHGLDRPRTAAVCLGTEVAIREPCLHALGYVITNESRGDVSCIIDQCRQLPLPAHDACFSAAATELVFQNYPRWQTAAPTICQASSPTAQRACHDRLNLTISQYHR